MNIVWELEQSRGNRKLVSSKVGNLQYKAKGPKE